MGLKKWAKKAWHAPKKIAEKGMEGIEKVLEKAPSIALDTTKAYTKLLTGDISGAAESGMAAAQSTMSIAQKEGGYQAPVAANMPVEISEEERKRRARQDALARLRSAQQLTPGRSQVTGGGARGRTVLNSQSLSNKNLLTG